jgi:hypothetical protein
MKVLLALLLAGCAYETVQRKINDSWICVRLCDATARSLSMSLRAGQVCVCSEESPTHRVWKVPIGPEVQAQRKRAPLRAWVRR